MNCQIIAECCQNHNGNPEVLKKMIHLAAENGADYCKIQSIRSKDLTHRPRFDEGETAEDGTVKVIKRPFEPEMARLSKLDLSLETEAWFADECKRAGIKSMTTAFTRTAVHEIKDMGFDAIKIASYDCASYPLLEEVKKFWSSIFVSTGATYDEEIEKAAQVLAGTAYHFLHCVTLYPTPTHDMNLRRMDFLRRFTPNVGYSDHSKPVDTGLWPTKIAIALGASCVERHYTILGRDETKDGVVSVTPEEVHELSEFSKLNRYEQMQIINRECPNWEVSLGSSRRELSHAEKLNRDYFRGRFANKINGEFIYNWQNIY